MQQLKFYSAMAALPKLSYRAKIMLLAFIGTHVPLLAIIVFDVVRSSSDMLTVWLTIGIALLATLLGTGATLFVLNAMLAPVVLTAGALRAFRGRREITDLPEHFGDEAGTLMADAHRTIIQLDEMLTTLETTDIVTGLGNRHKLLAEIGAAITIGKPVGLAVLRLHNLDRVAAVYDQRTADSLMRVLSAKLAGLLGDNAGTLARVEPGAFGVLLPIDKRIDRDALSARLRHLIDDLDETVGLGSIEIVPQFTGGLTLFPDTGDEAALLLDQAIAASAMTAPLQSVNFHSPAVQGAERARFEMEQELRKAIAGEQFMLHYQPVVDAERGEAVGAEALIRWQHPERGLVSPGLFIPTAERSGLIDDIGRWVIREACRQIGTWQSTEQQALKVAINLSARQFLDPKLTDLLSEAMDGARVRPDRLEIELTESAAMVDHDHTRRTFTRLKDLGVSIAIDDFGTGYASMSYLRKLPFDKLKIDREFVTNVDRDPGMQAICNAMIALSNGLGLRVLAEGTERLEEVDYLLAHGCHLFQGYYFSKPVPVLDLPETLLDISMKLGERQSPPMPVELAQAG